jgi:hypothetical protein
LEGWKRPTIRPAGPVNVTSGMGLGGLFVDPWKTVPGPSQRSMAS